MPQGSAGSWPLDDRVLRVFAGLTAFVLVMAALREAASVFVPATFALFVIAVVWPLQRTLQHALPKLAALVLTVITTLVAIVAIAFLTSWGFGRVGQWMVANAGRFQEVYLRQVAWLDNHGIAVAGVIADYFDMRWVVGLAQGVTGRMRSFLSFTTVTLVFTMLGLLEVQTGQRKLARVGRQGGGVTLLRAAAEIARKMQTYMLIRTIMSAVTGLSVWAFASPSG